MTEIEMPNNINVPVFQFVTVTKPGQDWKNGNEHVVRSHAMKYVRRQERHKSKQSDLEHTTGVKSRRNTYIESSSNSAGHEVKAAKASSHDKQALTRHVFKDGRLSRIDRDRAIMMHTHDQFLVQQPAIHSLKPVEYQLLCHISNLYSPLLDSISSKFVAWIKSVKQLMAIAFSSDYTMHAVLAWAATHLSKMTGDTKMMQQIYYHRVRAFKGIQEAVQDISKGNSDAALCASIVMSWQASDANTWATLNRGSQAVKDTMATRKYQSTLEDHSKQSDALVHSATLFTNVVDADAQATRQQTVDTRESLLTDAWLSLHRLQTSVITNPGLWDAAEDLKIFIESVQGKHSAATQYELARPLKDMVFWFPAKFIPIINTDPSVLLLVAHIHAIALFAVAIDNPNSACFRSLNVAPIKAFCEELMARSTEGREIGNEGQMKKYGEAIQMMEFPLKAVADFQARTTVSGASPLRDAQHSPGCCCGSSTYDVAQAPTNLEILERFPVGMWHNSIP